MITLEGALFLALTVPVVLLGAVEVSSAFDAKFAAQVAAIEAACPSSQ